MLYLVKLLVVLSVSGCCADENELWKTFKGSHGQKINKTNLFFQYNQMCPILRGRGAWARYKNANVTEDMCLYRLCTDSFYCHCRGSCCYDSPVGYLVTSFFDPSVYPSYKTGILYVMVEQCPYDSVDEMKQNCENKDLNPVTSTKTGITYKNTFCAHCHGDKMLVKWKLTFTCPEEGRTVSPQIKNSGRFCFIQYKLEEQYSELAPQCGKTVTTEKHLSVSRCNETGMWKDYDRDIEWACRQFNRPYKHFKNIFCYICNPSVFTAEMSHTTPLISTCDSEPPLRPDNTSVRIKSNTTLEGKCKTSDIIPRLRPFRNAYCYACFEPVTNSFYQDIGNFNILNIHEKTFLLQITINGVLSEKVTLESFEENLKLIVRLFSHQTEEIFAGGNETIKNDFDIEKSEKFKDPQKLIENWVDVCSPNSICMESYAHTNYSDIYPPCQYCYCNRRCLISRYDLCCLDKLIMLKPHECIPESSFPVLKKAALEETDSTLITHKVVGNCFNNNVNDTYRKKCMNGGMYDVLANLPVETSGKSDLAFKNIFCLLCNVDAPINEVKVYLRVQCHDNFEVEVLPTIQHVLELVKHHNCKVSFALDETDTAYNECSLDIKAVVETNRAFVCRGNSSMEGERTDINKLCMDNEFPFLVNDVSYKHMVCLNCDKLFHHSRRTTPKISTIVQCKRRNTSAISSEHLCFIEDGSLQDFKYGGRFPEQMSYRSLFTVSRTELERLQLMKYKRCRKGTFDITTGTCIPLFCSSDRILENGSCINVFESLVDTMFQTNMVLQPCAVCKSNDENGTNNGNEKKSRAPDTYPVQILDLATEDICNSIHELLDKTSGNTTDISYVHCHFKAYYCNKEYFRLRENVSEQDSTEAWDISEKTIIHARVSVHVESSDSRSRTEKQMLDITEDKVFRIPEVWLCHSENKSPSDDAICGEHESIIPSTKMHTNTPRSLVHIKKTLLCPLIELAVTNITTNQTTGNIIFNYLKTEISVPRGSVDVIKYTKSKWRLRICKDDLKIPNFLFKTSESRAYFLFSTSCNALSLVSLVLTLLTYIAFKVLRTVPGKNNMNLALCLLLAQASLQYPYNSHNSSSNIQCQVLGVCIHYFWLATFCALNVCSFHMYKVFSGRLMLVHNYDKSVFHKYALYVYGCPTLITSAAVAVNIAALGSLGYGVTRCFLDNFYSVILTFLLPSCLIFLTNIIFYGKTFYIIYNSPTLRCNIEERSALVIYVKLCTITGVAWPLLFVDALFPLSVFSYIATFTNAMQGFFIFISFICNRRVWNLYKDYISGRREQDTVLSKTETLSRAKPLKKQ